MKRILLILSTFSALMAVFSCNKAVDADPVSADAADAIVFGVSHSGLLTKATDATSITSFKCEATQGLSGSETNASPCWNNVVFTSDGESTPTYKGDKFWPLLDPSYNFYGVAATSGSAAAVASAAPDLAFAAGGSTITLGAAYDKDVVCAYKPYGDITWKTKNTLVFEHIFAQVSTVKVTNTDTDAAISNITIVLVDPKTGGTYNLRTGAGQTDGTGWSDKVPTESGSQTLYTNAGSIAVGGDNTGGDNAYYVVPGEYYLKATWTASVDDYSQTYTAMLSTSAISLVAGKRNAIEVELNGDAAGMQFGVSLSGWGSNTVEDVEFNHS